MARGDNLAKRGKTAPNPSDRGKPGSKVHALIVTHSAPLAISPPAANRHDVTPKLFLSVTARSADKPLNL